VATSLIDEALDLPELPLSSQDISGDMLFWDDFFLSDSAHLPEEENIWSGDLEEDGNGLDPACQVNSAEVAEDIVSNISQTSRSSWDSGVDDKNNDESMSYVSDPLKSESCTRMVSLQLPSCSTVS
jgi:hypothetical protein